MGLSSITFRSEVLCIEDVSEVLISVEWAISEQLTVRADVRRLASDTILTLVTTAWVVVVLVAVGILVQVALDQRRLERR